jgi:tetratricopeptide (TPR) repeat protein
MSVDVTDSSLKDPLYHSALRRLQQGEWEAGLEALATLVVRYPLDRELRNLRQEMQVRARVDQDEHEDLALAKRRRVKRAATRFGAVLLMIIAAFWGVRSYSFWFRQQAERVNQTLQREIQEADLAATFRDAQSLLRAGRLEEAKAKLDAIAAQDPGYPDLEAALSQVEAAASLDARYTQAMQLIEQQEWAEAKAILEALAVEAPNYRDVAIQLANIDKLFMLDDLLTQADDDFEAQHWEAAASQYESIRALDPTYQRERVEERLFRSYVEAATIALVGETDLLKALQTAENYFGKALALRPLAPEIKTQRELARLYLKAQSDFNAGRWSDVIADLEFVYTTDPDYALGTTRQTLYEAYVARGDSALAAAEYETALSDYQRAIELAKQNPDAVLRLYEVNLKAAEAQRIKGDYASAVLYYRAAVELSYLKERALENQNAALVATLDEAENYATAGNFSVAAERYNVAIRLASTDSSAQETKTHVVQPGEYLILLASLYHSTVQAIVAANAVENPRLIYVGQELVIPVFP